MVDRNAERKASDLENSTFLTEEAVQSDAEFDLDSEVFSKDQNDDEANREHQEGEGADDSAAANIADSEIDGLKSNDEVPAGEQQPIVKPEDVAKTVPPVPAIGEPPAGSPPPVAEAPAIPSPAPTEVKPGEQQAAPAAPPAGAPAGEVQPPSEMDIQETYKQWRGQSEDLLATHYYGLSPEVQAELELEPAKVIPRLMAKVYLDAMTASIGQMTMHFPRLVRLVNEQMERENSSENEFFKAWPKLKGKEEDIRRFGAAWRKLNPAASAQDFVNEVGAGVMVALRLDPTERPIGNQMPSGQTPAFVPGIGSPPRSPGRNVNGDNPFTQFNQEFEEDVDDDFG